MNTDDIPFMEVAERIRMAIAITNQQFVFLYCNPIMLQLIGLTKEQVVGQSLADVMRLSHSMSRGMHLEGRTIEESIETLTAITEAVSKREFINDNGESQYFRMYRLNLACGAHVVFGSEITELVNTKKQLEKAVHELKIQASTDELTQLNNRRALMTFADAECCRAKRYNNPVSAILIDIDFFKKINDTLGHQAGDEVLINISSLIKSALRETDQPGRIGGEEFAVILPETDLTGAKTIAERLRKTIQQTIITLSCGQHVSVTCSMGVAQLTNQDTDTSTLLARADKALYNAKRAGRNRVELA